MPALAQPEFPFASLAFPGRTSLYPHEIAERIGCSLDQVYDLADEGALRAIDIASPGAARRELRVPIEAWVEFVLARQTDPTVRAHFFRTISRPALLRLREEIDALITEGGA